MKVFGIMVLRNEADILSVNIRYHLSIGIDHFLVVDNGSTDGTGRILQDLSRDGIVEWTSNSGLYRQAEITTELAREAHRKGAEWIIPIDADEFWCSPVSGFRSVLENSRAGAIQVEVLNFIQRRDQTDASPEGLLHMTRRAPLPVGPLEQVRELVEGQQFAYVEMMYSPKFVSRASGDIRIAMGNHGVDGVAGPVEISDQILCFHAALRARRVLEAKVEHGVRVAELGLKPEQGWHVRRWLRVAEGEGLEREWRANSYKNDCLDVYGVQHPVSYDPRLRDLLAPYIGRGEAGSAESDRVALLRTIHEEFSAHQRESCRLLRLLRTNIDSQAQIISGLQEEMQGKVAECSRVITCLQQELQNKVGERDRMIGDLQAELTGRVAERDRLITELQAELQEKIAERDRMIGDLQAELAEKVSERDQLISDLQRRVAEQDQIIIDKEEQLRSTVAERDRQVAAFQEELEDIRNSKLWRFFNVLRGKKHPKSGR